MIREAMDAYLAEERAPCDADDEDEGIRNTDRDPILKQIGMVKDGPSSHGARTYKQDLYGGDRGLFTLGFVDSAAWIVLTVTM